MLKYFLFIFTESPKTMVKTTKEAEYIKGKYISVIYSITYKTRPKTSRCSLIFVAPHGCMEVKKARLKETPHYMHILGW